VPFLHSKTLLVESRDDFAAIRRLMSTYVPWGEKEADWPVKIQEAGSVEKLLDEGSIPVLLKSNESRTLGVVLDANDKLETRWSQIRTRCVAVFPNCPGRCPREGLVLANQENRRFGVWIMPDNESHGMLETFLMHLVPPPLVPLRTFAETAVNEARSRGAQFREPHRDKAVIHTWLAWQDPPGRPFGVALANRILDPDSSVAGPFVSWFRGLFEL